MERLLYTMCLTLVAAMTLVFMGLAVYIATAPADALLSSHATELRLMLVVAVLVLWVVIVCPLIVIFLLVRDRARELSTPKATPNRDLLRD